MKSSPLRANKRPTHMVVQGVHRLGDNETPLPSLSLVDPHRCNAPNQENHRNLSNRAGWSQDQYVTIGGEGGADQDGKGMRPAQGFSIGRMVGAGTDSLAANKALNIRYLEREVHNSEEGQWLVVRVATLIANNCTAFCPRRFAEAANGRCFAGIWVRCGMNQ